MGSKSIIAFALFLTVATTSGNDVPARSVGIRCDGRSDDTKSINKAISELQSGDTLILPSSAVCHTSNLIQIINKTDVTLLGGGASSQIVARRAALSAIFVQASSGITLKNFKHSSPFARRITWHPASAGLVLNASSNVLIQGVTVDKVADHGILVGFSKDVTIEHCVISGARHHGIHVHRHSENILVQRNTVSNIGRDGISVIDWGSDIKSKNIKFMFNTVTRTEICGIRVGTAETVQVVGNTVKETYLTGIQLQCAPPNGNGLTNVLVENNTIIDCPRENKDNNRWEAGIRVNTNLQILEGITISKNVIRNPRAIAPNGHQTAAMYVSTDQSGFIDDLNILDNTITDDSGNVKRCINDLSWFAVGKYTISGNTLNNANCPDASH